MGLQLSNCGAWSYWAWNSFLCSKAELPSLCCTSICLHKKAHGCIYLKQQYYYYYYKVKTTCSPLIQNKLQSKILILNTTARILTVNSESYEQIQNIKAKFLRIALSIFFLNQAPCNSSSQFIKLKLLILLKARPKPYVHIIAYQQCSSRRIWHSVLLVNYMFS